MPSFYNITNPVDSSGRTRRTVGETYDDLYELGREVKKQEGAGIGRLINPWDVQYFALNPGSERTWNAGIRKKQLEEQQRMALVNEAERAKKSATSMAMSGMSAEERRKYRKALMAQQAEEELRLYLEQQSSEAAAKKKGLMPRSIQAPSEEKPFDALDRMEDERVAQSRRGMLPGRERY